MSDAYETRVQRFARKLTAHGGPVSFNDAAHIAGEPDINNARTLYQHLEYGGALRFLVEQGIVRPNLNSWAAWTGGFEHLALPDTITWVNPKVEANKERLAVIPEADVAEAGETMEMVVSLRGKRVVKETVIDRTADTYEKSAHLQQKIKAQADVIVDQGRTINELTAENASLRDENLSMRARLGAILVDQMLTAEINIGLQKPVQPKPFQQAA